MIKRRPKGRELKQIPNYKLAMVLTKTSERILIGSEEDIKDRLEGQEDIKLLYDETRPFGTLLLSLDEDREGDCKVCNRLFFADSLRYELCSDECREQMRIDLLALRKKDENISNVDRICTNASAQWYNRLKKIKSSNEYSEEDVKTYSLAKDRFLEKKREKRKAFKKGEITYKELQNWLLHQEVEAQEMLESIQLRKCNES